MIITLIGTSGVGKSYWSSQLEQEAGFKRISCDEIIGQRLSEKLKHLGVKTDLKSIAEWRGLPYERRYKSNAAFQIQDEQEVMGRVCNELVDMQSKHENIVVDTAGSFVYIDPAVSAKLKSLSTMVYFVAGEAQVKDLYNDEVIFNRPLVWGDAYKPLPDESTEQAMRRCFADVVTWRADQYAKWADISINYEILRNELKTADDLLKLLS